MRAKDDMFSQIEYFSMYAAYRAGKKAVDTGRLKEMCGDLIQMAVQKSSGQHRTVDGKHMDWDNWERTRIDVISQGIALVKSGLLSEIENCTTRHERDVKREFPTWGFLHGGKYKKTDFVNCSTFDCMKPGNIEPDIEALKNFVELVPAFIKKETYIDGEYLKNGILCETVILVLSGKLEQLMIEEKCEVKHV